MANRPDRKVRGIHGQSVNWKGHDVYFLNYYPTAIKEELLNGAFWKDINEHFEQHFFFDRAVENSYKQMCRNIAEVVIRRNHENFFRLRSG